MAYEEAYIQHAQRRFELLDYASIDDEELDYFKWNAHVLALEKLFKPNGDPKSIQIKEDVWLTYLIKTGVPSLNRWREDTDAFADQFDDQILEKIKGIAKTVLGILEKDF
uniref:Uncharacterized protein n=1 Tax=Panagrolaimus davidi TaxID=227884 RepID=A0A914Q0I7_9BILA